MRLRWLLFCVAAVTFVVALKHRQKELDASFEAGRQYERSFTWAQVMERMPEYEAFDRGYAWACDSIASAQALQQAVREHAKHEQAAQGGGR